MCLDWYLLYSSDFFNFILLISPDVDLDYLIVWKDILRFLLLLLLFFFMGHIFFHYLHSLRLYNILCFWFPPKPYDQLFVLLVFPGFQQGLLVILVQELLLTELVAYLGSPVVESVDAYSGHDSREV